MSSFCYGNVQEGPRAIIKYRCREEVVETSVKDGYKYIIVKNKR